MTLLVMKYSFIHFEDEIKSGVIENRSTEIK